VSADALAGCGCLVVGYDRTAGARAAANWAAAQLRSDGRLVIVHAARAQHAPPSPLSTPAERRELAQAVIDELLMEADGSLLDLDIAAEVSDSDPVGALLEAARSHGAQAIVVGHKRHSRLHKALGTVTSGLLESSPVPVVTVPPGTSSEAERPLARSADRSR
jgi:nucleotide-binding universal stress UspA family protein